MKKISIKDVAKKANVSNATVSKVFNNYKGVNKETRDAVLKASDELGYVPNTFASSLSKKTHKKIALIMRARHDNFYVDEINMIYATSIFEEAEKHGYDILLLFNTIFNNKSEKETVNYLKSRNINGVIMHGLNYNSIKMKAISEDDTFFKVIIDSNIYNKRTSSVDVDNYIAQYDIIKHVLQKCNVNNVAYLTGSSYLDVANFRTNAAKYLGIKTIYDADFNLNKAYDFVKNNPNYEAYICASDIMAISVINALRELNLENKIVAGFDGIRLLDFVNYPLVTVKQDFVKKAQTAITLIKELYEGKDGRHCVISHQIKQYD